MDEIQNANRKQARFVTSLFFILAGILSATWSSRIPDVQQSFGLNDQVWGTVLFSLPAGLISGLAVASWLSTRFGAATIMISGCIISSAFLAITGFVDSVYLLIIFLFLIGFTRTIFNIAVNTNAVIVQKSFDRPIISTFHGLWSLACFLAAGISTVMIIKGVAPALHFTIIAIACTSVAFILKNRIKSKEKINKEKKPFIVKPDKYLLVLGVIAFCTMLCESTMFDWSVNYFDRIVRVDKGLITVGYTSFIITMALGRLFGDRIVGRYGARRIIIMNGCHYSYRFINCSSFSIFSTGCFWFFISRAGRFYNNSCIIFLICKIQNNAAQLCYNISNNDRICRFFIRTNYYRIYF
jgi:MFS family permease